LVLWQRLCLGLAALLLISPSLLLGLGAVLVCGIVVVSQLRDKPQGRFEASS
jgi:predicted membrane metal-binding protein